MNNQILKQYIREYKVNFERVNRLEIYKWQAIKCFHDNWDIDSPAFVQMISASFEKAGNLLASGQYFPLRMIIEYANRNPEQVREMFRKLYDEEQDLFDRIETFQFEAALINDEHFVGKNTYQDHRALLVYLVLNFPERYFFYKFKMFKEFCEKIEYIYRPTSGSLANLSQFKNLCEIVRHQLSLDQELLRMHSKRILEDCYYDETLNVLTQDFIYAVVEHLAPINTLKSSIPPEPVTTYALCKDLATITTGNTFQGRVVNFLENGIKNKRIGDLGELCAIDFEVRKLRAANKLELINQLKHTAKDEGDGTGFDVQSFDVNGNKIFIEVKTTTGPLNSVFYITKAELERSKIEKDKYFLYRLYNFNEDSNTADFFIINGDLSNICDTPTSFKVLLRAN